MAKKRTGKPKKKRTKSTIWTDVKRFVAIVCVSLVLLTGLIFAYLHFLPEDKAQLTVDKFVHKIPEIVEKKYPVRLQSKDIPQKAEIPVLKNGQREQIIAHEGYTVSYNAIFKIPNWVAYELTEEKIKNAKAKRHNKFVPDPQVKGATAMNEDYSHTGYDRGHMVPAGDMKWSEKVMRETFYFSNICPQDRGLNSGVWNDLEMTIRVWAKENKLIYIVCGPIIEDDLKRLGNNRVGVPRKFYKVVWTLKKRKPLVLS
jgi:endonuclease G